jgi:hypothetical protein
MQGEVKYMSIRKQSEKNIRKLQKMGKTSLGLTLPIELVSGLAWREKQRVVVKKINGGLVIRDFRNKR